MHSMFLPFRRYFDFHGRSRRSEFWLFVLFNALLVALFWVVVVVLFLDTFLDLAQAYGGGSYQTYSYGVGYTTSYELNLPPEVFFQAIGPGGLALFSLYGLYHLIVAIPMIAVTIRRLHDQDRSGWWVLAPYLSYPAVFLFAALATADPDQGLIWAMLLIAAISVGGLLGLALLVFMFIDGTPGPNRFGPDPKGRDYYRAGHPGRSHPGGWR